MTIKWEEGRYITLEGDPVGPDWRPMVFPRSVFNKDLIASGAVTGLVLGACFSGNMGVRDALLTACVNGFETQLGSLGARILEKRLLRYYFGEAAQSLCIDTRPTQESLLVSAPYIPAAEKVRNIYLGAAFISAGLTVGSYSALKFFPPLQIAFFASVGGAARGLYGAYRFVLIGTQESAIITMPEAKKLEVKETAPVDLMGQLQIQPVPVRDNSLSL